LPGIFASPHEPNAAAILPQAIAAKVGIDVAGAMLAIIRLEGIDVSVADRAAHLLAAHKDGVKIDTDASTALWQQIRDVDLLADVDGDIWKLSCAPASSPAIIATLFDQFDFQFFA
jgi:glycolate oxidase FAD binding subunit